MSNTRKIKIGNVYVTATGQTLFVTKITGQGKAQKVHYLSTGKDVSKGWRIGGGPLSQGGTKMETFLQKIAKQVFFTIEPTGSV